MIELEKVSKIYDGRTALKEVTLQIIEGEWLTILGPSGSGKSTLLKLLAQLETPSAGKITSADGRVPRGVLVFQDGLLFPHLNVFENIAFGLEVKHLKKTKIREKVKEILNVIGMSGFAERYPAELSGGQAQRVALARALVLSPELLLLDEPFSSLDPLLRSELRQFVKKLQQQLALTVVFVTHDQAESYLLSDRIALLLDGVIQQVAAPVKLSQAPRNLAVARFLGNYNFIPVELHAGELRAPFGCFAWAAQKKSGCYWWALPYAADVSLAVDHSEEANFRVVRSAWDGEHWQTKVCAAGITCIFYQNQPLTAGEHVRLRLGAERGLLYENLDFDPRLSF